MSGFYDLRPLLITMLSTDYRGVQKVLLNGPLMDHFDTINPN